MKVSVAERPPCTVWTYSRLGWIVLRPPNEELSTVRTGGAKLKAVRGEYGTGKTFFSCWMSESGCGGLIWR